MNVQNINQTYDLLSLAQSDTKLKHAGKYYIGACPFCGGTDRFNLTQKPDGWRWLCRHCTDTKYKTPIDYIMRRDDIDFKQALANMGGSSCSPAPRPHRESIEPAKPEIVLPDSEWQMKHRKAIFAASDKALLANKPAREYLTSRKINRGMWNVYWLGFVMIYDPRTNRNRPAISIPWMDEEETITAIKYRFIDELAKDKAHRYTMAKGSKQILFGMQIAGGYKNLIFVEGEFNAISIAQVTSNLRGYKIDALSFGSETASHVDILRSVAGDYENVIVWADDPEHASKISQSLNRPTEAICSPEIDGVKYDANALLQNGFLAQFLQETIKHPA